MDWLNLRNRPLHYFVIPAYILNFSSFHQIVFGWKTKKSTETKDVVELARCG